ncbi:MAG: GNAT family N-acetyltransferase [Massilia sp.]
MSQLRISPVAEGQYESLVDLLCELHAYYNEASPVTRDEVRTHLTQNLLGAGSPLLLVVADDEELGVVGFAAIALMHSLVDPRPAQRRQCHMKELYVRASQRGHGIGRALMTWIARYAEDQQCCRIDFHVQAANQAGIAFYTALGAAVVAKRSSYRIARPAIEGLARESEQPGFPTSRKN